MKLRVGLVIEEYTPGKEETCDFQRHQKIGGRWRHVACSRPAERGVTMGGTNNYAFCQHCLANAISQLIRILY